MNIGKLEELAEEHRNFTIPKTQKILRSSRLLKPKEKNLILLFQFRRNKSGKIEIELKSLILAQIERWRHALHMQVERQRGSLLLAASGARVSNASERVFLWGITVRKDS